MRGKIGRVRDRENFNKLVSRGNGKLADNAKREEYERQIRLKKVKSTKPDDYDERAHTKLAAAISKIRRLADILK